MENYERKSNCVCLECNKGIYRRPKQIETGPVFCSLTCAQIRNRIKQERNCVVCNKDISHKRNGQTCSRICSNKNRTGTNYKIGRPKDKCAKGRSLKFHLLDIRPHKCNRCPYDKIEILQVHHIVERSNNGTDDFDNLELLCPNCHFLHHYINKTKIEIN